MAAPFFPDEVCFANAAAKRTQLALSVIRLFQSTFIPSATTVKADLVAAEADYDDYASIAFTTWNAPTKSVFGGAEITAPLAQFTCATVQVVGNVIGGYWIELAAGAVVVVRQFDVAIPMAQLGDFVKVVPNYVFPPSA